LSVRREGRGWGQRRGGITRPHRKEAGQTEPPVTKMEKSELIKEYKRTVNKRPGPDMGRFLKKGRRGELTKTRRGRGGRLLKARMTWDADAGRQGWNRLKAKETRKQGKIKNACLIGREPGGLQVDFLET